VTTLFFVRQNKKLIGLFPEPEQRSITLAIILFNKQRRKDKRMGIRAEWSPTRGFNGDLI